MPKRIVFGLALLRERTKVDAVTGCWNWIGVPSQLYPTVGIDGAYYHVSRLICQHMQGGIKPDQHAMHKCDNPRCCRPSHIKVGTPKQNVRDCIAKGRFTGTTGQKMSAATKAKISKSRKKLCLNPEFIAKMADARRGIKHTAQGKANISKGVQKWLREKRSVENA